MLSLGEKLRKIRQEKGVSLKTASDDLGIAKSTLAGYEYDKREPGIEIISKMAEYYKANPIDLITPGKVPEYSWVDLKELLEREDISLDGKKLSNEDKEKIYRVSRAMLEE